MTFRKKKL